MSSKAIPAAGPNGRPWRKSSRSGAGNDCVGTTRESGQVFFCDTKNASNPSGELSFDSGIAAFMGKIRAGAFDLPANA